MKIYSIFSYSICENGVNFVHSNNFEWVVYMLAAIKPLWSAALVIFRTVFTISVASRTSFFIFIIFLLFSFRDALAIDGKLTDTNYNIRVYNFYYLVAVFGKPAVVYESRYNNRWEEIYWCTNTDFYIWTINRYVWWQIAHFNWMFFFFGLMECRR